MLSRRLVRLFAFIFLFSVVLGIVIPLFFAGASGARGMLWSQNAPAQGFTARDALDGTDSFETNVVNSFFKGLFGYDMRSNNRDADMQRVWAAWDGAASSTSSSSASVSSVSEMNEACPFPVDMNPEAGVLNDTALTQSMAEYTKCTYDNNPYVRERAPGVPEWSCPWHSFAAWKPFRFDLKAPRPTNDEPGHFSEIDEEGTGFTRVTSWNMAAELAKIKTTPLYMAGCLPRSLAFSTYVLRIRNAHNSTVFIFSNLLPLAAEKLSERAETAIRVSVGHGALDWKKKRTQLRVNVNIIMIDSTSRPQFFRAMPRVVNWLETLRDSSDGQYEVFQMMRYMVADCCSYGNQLPFFSGVNSLETDQPSSMPPKNSSLWLWNQYARRKGYVTRVGIGMCDHHSNFEFQQNPSADYVWWEGHCTRERLVRGEWPRDSDCSLGRESGEFQLQDNERFLRRYGAHSAQGVDSADVRMKQFAVDGQVGAFTWTALLHAHEYTMGVLRTLDKPLFDHLERITDPAIFPQANNTIHILYADHGIGFGSMSGTPAGRYEVRWPFLFFVVPEAVLRAHPRIRENLRANIDRMVVPADMYLTLMHLLDYDDETPRPEPIKVAPEDLSPHTHRAPKWKQMLSLVGQKIPAKRNCMSAGVPNSQCQCDPLKVISMLEHPLTILLANHAEIVMQRHLEEHDNSKRRRCLKVAVEDFVGASLQLLTQYDENGNKIDSMQRYYTSFIVVGEEFRVEANVNATMLAWANELIAKPMSDPRVRSHAGDLSLRVWGRRKAAKKSAGDPAEPYSPMGIFKQLVMSARLNHDSLALLFPELVILRVSPIGARMCGFRDKITERYCVCKLSHIFMPGLDIDI